MRSLSQFQFVGNHEILALDDDGFLWHGTIGQIDRKIGNTVKVEWRALQGPDDDEPFVDRRSRLDKIEDTIRDAERKRTALLGAQEGKADSG